MNLFIRSDIATEAIVLYFIPCLECSLRYTDTLIHFLW